MDKFSKSEQIQKALEHINGLTRHRSWLQTLIQEQRNNLNTIKLRERCGNFQVSAIRIDDGDSSFDIKFNPHVKGMDMSQVKDIVSGMINEMEAELYEIEKEIEGCLKL